MRKIIYVLFAVIAFSLLSSSNTSAQRNPKDLVLSGTYPRGSYEFYAYTSGYMDAVRGISIDQSERYSRLSYDLKNIYQDGLEDWYNGKSQPIGPLDPNWPYWPGTIIDTPNPPTPGPGPLDPFGPTPFTIIP